MLRALVAAVGCAGVAFAPAAADGAVAQEAPPAVAAAPAGAAPTGAAAPAAAPADAVAPVGVEGAAAPGAAPADAAAPVGVEGAAAERASAPPAPRLPAVEVTGAKKVRHDAYVGFGLGFGGGNLRQSGAGSAGSVAVTGLIRGGARITDKVGLGGLVVTSFGGDKQAVSGFSNLLGEALFFPIKDRGLGVAVALGVSSAWVRVPGSDGVLVDKSTKVGAAFGLGLGYDFWLARRFNLGLWLRADGSAGGFGVRAAGTFGLGFSWY